MYDVSEYPHIARYRQTSRRVWDTCSRVSHIVCMLDSVPEPFAAHPIVLITCFHTVARSHPGQRQTRRGTKRFTASEQHQCPQNTMAADGEVVLEKMRAALKDRGSAGITGLARNFKVQLGLSPRPVRQSGV
eukprot:6206946-Pleurochrysis_carterae.AAC.1